MPYSAVRRLLPAVAILSFGLAASAREVLTPEEITEREVEARKNAPPALNVEPGELRSALARGEAKSLRLSVKNAGGGKLSWSVLSAPRWARPDKLSGDLGFGEEATLVLLVDPGQVDVGPEGGEARGEVVIEAPGVEGSPATAILLIDVPAGAVKPAPARTVAAPAGMPTLECAPATIQATVNQGDKVELPLTVKNTGSGKMSWYISSAPEWVAFDAKSGELTSGDARRLFLKVDSTKLGAGTLEDKIVVESTRGSQRVASLPVQLKIKYMPKGIWTLRVIASQAIANTGVESGPFSSWAETSSGPNPGFDMVRTWATPRFDVCFELSFARPSSERYETFRTEYRRTFFGAGLGFAFPSGSRLKGVLSAGYSFMELDIEDIGPFGEDARASGAGPYFGAGVILALGRRFSLQLQGRFFRMSEEGEYAGSPAWIEDTLITLGAGLAIHY